MRLPPLLMLVILSCIWGNSFLFTKVTVEEVPPLTLVEGRLLLAGAVLLLLMRGLGLSLSLTPRLWAAITFMGLVNNVIPFALITWGQQHIDSSLAAILNGTMPLFTVAIAPLWIKEPLTGERAAGVLIGFAGVFVLLGPDLGAIAESSTLGQLAVIGASLCYATGAVFARRYLQERQPVVFATSQMVVASALLLPVALAVDTPFDLRVSAKAALAWTALGVLSSGLAYIIFFWLIQRIAAMQLSLVAYLIPLVAVFMGWLVLDERLGANSFSGLALIVLGVFIVNGTWREVWRRLRPAAVLRDDSARSGR
ncbi:MAG: EamA family transporter [Candidatus Bathyarchaeota archaeon]|nr:EamA family transporter [Candidatus Bathyarchaeota archaeon]